MSARILGDRISPSQRLKYAAQLRELWAKDPNLTCTRARELTGAPFALVNETRLRLVKAGVLLPGRQGLKE